jgi:hypothetical protein
MDVTERKVSWGVVIGGIAVALIAGFIVTIFSTLGGMYVFDQVHSKAVGVLVAVGAPVALIAIVYLATRRRSPDFARGVIIGGCLVLLWSSACGFSMVGARIAG